MQDIIAEWVVLCNMDVAGYIRVSTEQQKADGSHENQRDELERWADRNDHTITFFEDIAISGQSDEREAYAELMDRAEEFDAVVVRELSRFGRSLQKVLNDVDELADRDVDFISLKENIDLSTAQGKLFLNMIGAFNQFWADLARERANEMVQRRREEGKPLGRPRKVDDETLEQIYEWRDMGLSYSAIAALVQDMTGESINQSTIYRYCKQNEAGES